MVPAGQTAPALCRSLWFLCGRSTGCRRGPSLSVGASPGAVPQKGAQGGRGRVVVVVRGWRCWRKRISPTRCVSSRSIWHPLNLYCSSTGSIGRIDGALALLRQVCEREKREKQQQRRRLKLSVRRDVTLDRVPMRLRLLVSPLSMRASISQRSSSVSAFKRDDCVRRALLYLPASSICCISPFKFQLHFRLPYI